LTIYGGNPAGSKVGGGVRRKKNFGKNDGQWGNMASDFTLSLIATTTTNLIRNKVP
jgi:hypothetical protein